VSGRISLQVAYRVHVAQSAASADCAIRKQFALASGSALTAARSVTCARVWRIILPQSIIQHCAGRFDWSDRGHPRIWKPPANLPHAYPLRWTIADLPESPLTAQNSFFGTPIGCRGVKDSANLREHPDRPPGTRHRTPPNALAGPGPQVSAGRL